MKLQVLLSTMHKNDTEFVDKINATTDILIINQCDHVGYIRRELGKQCIEMYSFNEIGLSRSRNNGLMRANADIVCIADDDMVYSDTYEKDIINEFEKHPYADMIIFNVEGINGSRNAKIIKKFEKIKSWEYKDYGSVHIAFRLKKLLISNIWFNITFGSGAHYNCGEDTIFLKDVLKHGLNVYKSPIRIAKVDMSQSSWFKGYNEKYFNTKGALLAYIYPAGCYFISLLLSIKNSKEKLGSFSKVVKLYSWYLAGIRDFKKRKQK